MMRKYTFFWVLLTAFLLIPSRAFAWDFLPDGQMWAGDVGSSHCATVHAGEIYDAATYAVGSDPNKISASVRVKLSDPNYGGRFYEYAQTFHKMESWDDYPEWLPAYVGVAQLVSNGLIGDFNIYNSEASSTLYNGAVLDFQRVLAGEDLGGGGSSSGVPSTFTVNSEDLWFDGGIEVLNFSVNNVRSFVYNFSLSSSVVSFLNSHIETHPYFYVVVCPYRTNFNYNKINNNMCLVDFVLSPAPLSTSTGSTYWIGGSNCYHAQARYDVAKNGVTSVSFGSSLSLGTFGQSRDSNRCMWVKRVTGVDPPAGTWPEPTTPVTPDPPEQPTPTAPTVTPDTDPTEPVVTWPTSPTVVLPTQPTPSTTPSGLDYTGLLTLINDNLISIDDYVQALNSSFNSFRADFVSAVDSIVDSIRNIYSYLGHLNDILEVHCKHIRDQIEDSVYDLELYLMELFEWLPRQLNFDAQFTYDDTYVTMLLRRILNKIPGGSSGTPVSYKPNPQSDEPGFFDWLLDLWHRFLIDLVSVLPDSLGGLVDTFSQLTHYFPFSIPWDVFALLSLFAHDPVTPVFDIPWGYGGGDGEVQLIHIDLSVWNDMMATVRPVFLVGFCIRLALVTKEMLSNFDINKGGV